MANKEITQKINVNKKYFMKVLEERHQSIRKLGNEWEKIGRTEKTIRRCLDAGEMPEELLDRIARFLDVSPDYLAGKYQEDADKTEDELLKQIKWASLSAAKKPYLLRAQEELDYSRHFEDILTMNNISMQQFKSLPPEERVLMRQEMAYATMSVIAKHFKTDSFGYDTSEILMYCEAMIGDDDPTSAFHLMEGIGITEEELFAMSSDNK